MHVNTRLKVNFDKYGFQLALVNQPVQPYSDNETKSMGTMHKAVEQISQACSG